MDLYKGSKLNTNPFKPQPIHPDDFYKFPKPIPDSVIFASNSETKAKIFATLSEIISFGISSTSKKPYITIIMRNPIEPETLEENVYLYKFDSDIGEWKYLEESGEWYNTKEQIPTEVKEYTRGELYKELRENPEISFQEEFTKEGSTIVS